MTQTTFDFLRDNIAQIPFHQWLRPELVALDEAAGAVTIRLANRPEFARAAGAAEMHGGILAAMVDITGHAAVAAKLRHSVPTIDMRVDYLRPAGGAALIGIGTAVRIGRTIGVVDVRLTDDRDSLVAIGRAAFVTRAL
jgi:uncharacterized protein (TIGR00369 family)